MPIAYNSYLDQLIREQRTGFSAVSFLVRTTGNNQWREATLEEALAKKFGTPFGCANAITVGTFRASSPPGLMPLLAIQACFQRTFAVSDRGSAEPLHRADGMAVSPATPFPCHWASGLAGRSSCPRHPVRFRGSGS